MKLIARSAVLCLGIMLWPALAVACEDGQVMTVGDSCEVDIKWGHDHWVMADIPQGEGKAIELRHLEGSCNVSLFGPLEIEGAIIGPESPVIRRTVSGEYHLFTRAVTVAKEACRFRVAID
ncbi:MAG: hypothetical protein AAF495_05875 [Pseudomonadota bacterium]